MTIKGAMLAASVAGLFSAASSAALAEGGGMDGKDGGHVMCAGVNSCKGHGACASASNACAGKNGCKGKGVMKMSKEDCAAKGGTVAPAKKMKK